MPLRSWTYREDYDAVMKYLTLTEPKYAPEFNMVEAPPELQELMYWAYMPRSERRSKFLNDFVERNWAKPDGTVEVLLAKDHLNAIRHMNQHLSEAN